MATSGVACGVRGAPLWSVVACGCGVRRRVAAAKASARQGQCGHEPGRLLSLAATLMLLARRSTEDPPERREAVQRPRAGLLLRAPHHSSQRMALRYFTLSSSLCAETIGGAWEVRLEKNMERVRAMASISFYLYEVGSARAPKGFPWWTAGMKIYGEIREKKTRFEIPRILAKYRRLAMHVKEMQPSVSVLDATAQPSSW